MKILRFTLIILAVYCLFGYSTYSKELRAITGLAIPPYIISENNTGMEMEIVREALKDSGYEFKMKYLPFISIRKSMESKEADIAFPLNEESGISNIYYSKTHITYQNVVITLKENNIKIGKTEDLIDKDIVAFQDATLYLGTNYKDVVMQNARYEEMAKQEGQVAKLFANRTEAIVIDINIFYYFKKFTKKVDTSKEVEIHKIFPQTFYKVGFNDRRLRDQFDIGLEKLKESGRYDEIIKKYIGKN